MLSLTDVLSMNDLYYRYSKTKTVDKYFEQQRKVYEMMKLYKETENRSLLYKIIRLCTVQTNTVILNTIRDKQIMQLMIEILIGNDRYKVGNATSILSQISKSYRSSFFQTLEEIPECFAKLIYHFDKISIYQMFNSFYDDKETPISSFSFIYYWIYAFSQSLKYPASITGAVFEVGMWKSVKPGIFDAFRKVVNYTKLIEEKPLSFINFFRSLSFFCKKSLDNPDFKLYQDLFIAASQYLLYPFSGICKPSSAERGTVKDDCVSALIELYLNLPRDKYVYFSCMDLLRNHFYGSKLAACAITYISNNLKNPAMNSYDYELLSISVPFRIYYINDDYLYFVNYRDPIKTRLVNESKPNNLTMQAGIEYIKSLLRTSASKIYQTKRNLIGLVTILWYNSLKCTLDEAGAKLVQSFLLKICMLVGDDSLNRVYHTIYQEIAVPFSKYLIDESSISSPTKTLNNKINQKDTTPICSPIKNPNNAASAKNSQPIEQLNLDFKKRWKTFDFELTREQTSFFDSMIEELDQLLKDSSFNLNTDFQFPDEEEEEEDE